LAGAFVRHRGLIALSAGVAMAEATALSFFAPSARALAPQVTALPPLAGYHDLRWLFAFNQSWLGFSGVLALLLLARSALDAVLLMLAWPRGPGRGAPVPRFVPSFVSCAVLTLLVGLVMSPVVTLMFGVALLPFSWPYLAAMPILLGTALALSQGGVGQAWWRRLPPAGTAAWLLATFAVLSLTSALMTHLNTPGIVALSGLAGVVDARAWYGLTAAAVRRSAEQPSPRGVRGDGSPRAGGHRGVGPRGLALLPLAPLAAVMVLALVVGAARLAFTGTVRFDPETGGVVRPVAGAVASAQPSEPVTASAAKPGGQVRRAVLVVAGFGSTCCHSAGPMQAAEPGALVRQFSYLGLDAAGNPVPYGVPAGNISIEVLGDRMAVQVQRLYRQSHAPVDIVAESEGTLGLYAMLARHPGVPVGSLVLLSPIVEPGQAGQADGTVPGDALSTLNNLVGGMSPYGSAGAQALIDSVSQVGASYFEMVRRDRGHPWLAVIPLADAVTLPACPWPQNVVFVDAFHGGLLGDAAVRPMIAAFLAGHPIPGDDDQDRLRREAQVIAAAAAAWRMPQLHPACQS
jgi:hypothetical protein